MARRVSKHHAAREAVRIDALSNKDLLKETLEMEAGDEPDGCCSPNGYVTRSLLNEELEWRLARWLREDHSCS